MVALSAELVAPFILLTFAAVAANGSMAPIANVCYIIMAAPKRDPTERVPRATRSSQQDGTTLVFDQHETYADQSTGAMKLALLVEKMPCTLLLLGWKISWSAVLACTAAALLSQALGAVGLGS
jgi:hypothetical protein